MGFIHVIGLSVVSMAVDPSSSDDGRSGRADLSTEARQVLSCTDLVIGSVRQLAAVAHELENRSDTVACIELPKLVELKALLEEHADSSVALLATGDPLLFGIGRWLGRHFSQSRLKFYPAVSSVQLACSRVGLSWQDIRVVSLHGRPVESLRLWLHRNAKLVVLTDANSHPARLARECSQAGFAYTRLSVFERLGYPDERIRQFTVSDLISSKLGSTANIQDGSSLLDPQFDDLNIVLLELADAKNIVKTVANEDVGDAHNSTVADETRREPARPLPEFPGIPDHHFVTGAQSGSGMITKREVRLAILSYLSASSDEIIWDVGAGCGSVAIELAYWKERVSVYAIEHHAMRLVHLHKNQFKFGVVKNLHIVKGHAPQVLDDLPLPDKVFIGGSDGQIDSLLSYLWPKLPAGGLLVASAVTGNTRGRLTAFAQTLDSTQVQSVDMLVKRGTLEHSGMHYTEKLPVSIFRFQK